MTKAYSIGKIASRAFSSGECGRVTRVFQNSAYVLFGEDMIVFLRGGPRSPIAVNLASGQSIWAAVSPGDRCSASGAIVELGMLKVDLRKAQTYTPRRRTGHLCLLSTTVLVRAAKALKALYSVSECSKGLLCMERFSEFCEWLVGMTEENKWTYVVAEQLAKFVGLGEGFTPAGDDFVCGFAAAYNRFAALSGREQLLIARETLVDKTLLESALLLDYGQHCHLDERMDAQISAMIQGRSGEYFHELLAVAPRGHTSGIDMSLGVLVCGSALAGAGRKDGTARKVIMELLETG